MPLGTSMKEIDKHGDIVGFPCPYGITARGPKTASHNLGRQPASASVETSRSKDIKDDRPAYDLLLRVAIQL